MRLLATFVLGALAATAQQSSEVLLRQTFETDTAGWAALGPGAAVHAANHALSLTYEPRPKQIAAALLPAPPAFDHFQRLRFRAKTDYDTALGVILSERAPGGWYVASFWPPANTWQEIELTPADFIVNDGPGDPVDPDGKLDTDSLQGIRIFDLAKFFGALPDNPEFPVVINRPSGSHTILLEDFRVLSSPRQPGGRELFHVNLKLADFEDAGKLDPAKLKSLGITGITAASGGAPATNTIWIGKVETLSN
jgi:hypothetical protein